MNNKVGNGSITNKDTIDWIVRIVISLVPLLIFYIKYQIDKKQSNKKIKELENMLYKEIIARKDLEIKELKKENEQLKKELEEVNKKKRKLGGGN